MTTEAHFRRLERLYHEAPVTALYGASVRIEHGRAQVTVPVDERFFHAANAVHGSVYFRALDDAAFFAANSMVEDVLLLTSSFHTQFLAPVTAGHLVATGTLLHQGGRLLSAEARLHDDDGRLVATGVGSFMRSSIRIDGLQ